MKLAALRHNIGVVYQEALLFNRSIADNLRVGNPDATDEQLREAAERAQATDLIERHPEGLAGIGRRARPLALRRRAPAPLDRARAAEGSADPDPRRGDQRARRHDRAQGAGRARRGDEGPHHLRDRASPRDRAQRRPASWCSIRAASSRAARSTNWSRRAGASPSSRSAQFLTARRRAPELTRRRAARTQARARNRAGGGDRRHDPTCAQCGEPCPVPAMSEHRLPHIPDAVGERSTSSVRSACGRNVRQRSQFACRLGSARIAARGAASATRRASAAIAPARDARERGARSPPSRHDLQDLAAAQAIGIEAGLRHQRAFPGLLSEKRRLFCAPPR